MADDNDASKKSGNQDPPKGIISEVANNLGPVYRHLLPGVLVVATAWLVRPCWFAGFHFDSWSYLTVVAVIATALGNASFAVNRYVIHQVVDWFCWRRGWAGPARKEKNRYREGLATYVSDALWNSKVPERARQHVSFRASSVLLIYLLAELLVVIGLFGHVGAIVLTCRHRTVLFSFTFVLIAGGIWQNVLTRQIDHAVMSKQ
jgi:hypothetical protein